jgi:tetratricopeptide (TPR) repeat protein
VLLAALSTLSEILIMNRSSNSRRRLYGILAGAIALALPSLALAQGQIDAGRANDASNRVGSGGRNQPGVMANYGNNYIINNGNQVVTGNVSQGREFHGNVGYTDPTAFRGFTAGSVSDNFAKNSYGVPQAHAPEPLPNQSKTFYGAAQTVAPPEGFQLNANRTGYVAQQQSELRGIQDRRLGVLDLNLPLAPMPQPGEMMMRGSLNPQQAAQDVGVLTGSLLYGLRQWNPQDPADRAFLDNLMNRQNGNALHNQIDPRDLQRMRNELDPEQQTTPGSQTFDAAGNPTVNNSALSNPVNNEPLGSKGLSTDQGIKYNVLGAAHRTSSQYSELEKRLEQYNAAKKTTLSDAQQFNADMKARRDAEAAAKLAAKNKNPNDLSTPPKLPTNPVTPEEDPTKSKVKKPKPMKVNTLAAGVRGEGLGSVMKKAEGLMKEGKYTSALDQYDIAETVTPNNPLIWLGRANAELGAGFFLRAEGHLRQALTTDKALLMGQYDLTGMLGEERLTKLVGDLKEIATKEPTKATAVFLLSYVAYNTGHEVQALGYLDMAEKRAPEQAGFYKMIREHWSLPDEGAKPKTGGVPAAKPELNK